MPQLQAGKLTHEIIFFKPDGTETGARTGTKVFVEAWRQWAMLESMPKDWKYDQSGYYAKFAGRYTIRNESYSTIIDGKVSYKPQVGWKLEDVTDEVVYYVASVSVMDRGAGFKISVMAEAPIEVNI